ncbi:MFS transporter [Eubacteriaceae bacterium ES2]|nr:MFS transporter [Eubacteriaceae bacterium ES2]
MPDVNVSRTNSKKGFMVVVLLFTMITATASGYSNNVVLPVFLTKMNMLDYYAVFAALSSMGMMTALPLGGSLSAKFGGKAVILFGLIAQFAARAIMVVVPNIIVFAILYTLAGFFSGLYMVAPYSVMAEVVSPEERPKHFGFVAAASAVGALTGPLLAGIISDIVSPEIAFVSYAIFAIIPIIGFTTSYPNRKVQMGKFDLLGIVYLVVFVCCLVMWLSLGNKLFSFVSPIGIALPILAITALTLMIRREAKIDNPAVPILMFKKKRFRYTFIIQALIVAYATCIGAYGIVYAQQIMQLGAMVSSTITMPQTIVQFIVGLFIGAFVGKAFKKRFRVVGLLSITTYLIGLLIFYTLTPDSAIFIIYLATGIGGIGQAISQSCYAAFFQTELKIEEIKQAQGMFAFSQTGGSSVFMAITGVLLTFGLTLNQVFLVGAIFVLTALVLAFFGFRFPKEEIEAETNAQLQNQNLVKGES